MEKAIQDKKTRTSFGEVIMNNKALAILIIVMVAAGATTNGLFFTSGNIKNVIRQVCASITLGCGFTVNMSSGGMDLSVGAIVSLLSVVSAKLAIIEGMPFGVVIVLTILIGAALGFLNGSIVNLLSLPAFVVTIGMKSIYEGIACIIAENKSIIGLPDAYAFIGQGYVFGIPFPIFIMVFLVLLTWFLINKTRFGRFCLARGGNPVAARACGINIKKISMLAYTFMGACGSISSIILTGRSASGQSGAGSGMEMDIIAAVVIGGTSMQGGIARVIGTVFGCLMIGTINNGLNLLGADSNWQKVAKGVIILIAIILDAYGAKFLNSRRKDDSRYTEKRELN